MNFWKKRQIDKSDDNFVIKTNDLEKLFFTSKSFYPILEVTDILNT